MAIYTILSSGRGTQSEYSVLLAYLSSKVSMNSILQSNTFLVLQIRGSPRRTFMQRIKLKSLRPSSSKYQRLRRQQLQCLPDAVAQWKSLFNLRRTRTLKMNPLRNQVMSIFFKFSSYLRFTLFSLKNSEAPKPTRGRRRATKSPSKARRARKSEDDEIEDPNYDEFYDKLNVRVPPSTYDTSDFDKSHLFHIRMSNYLR